jgi:hypothetical protein
MKELTNKEQVEMRNNLIKTLLTLKKERSIHEVINKSEYEEDCYDCVISSISDYLENHMSSDIEEID